MNEPSFLRAGACFQLREPAGTMSVPGKGEVPVVFAPDAFASQAGRVFPLTVLPGREVIGHARVREAVVSDDGASVLFTYEITDLSPGQAGSEGSAETGT